MTIREKEEIDSAELKEILIDAFSNPEKANFIRLPPNHPNCHPQFSVYRQFEARKVCLHHYHSGKLTIICIVDMSDVEKRLQIGKIYHLNSNDSLVVYNEYQQAYAMTKLL